MGLALSASSFAHKQFVAEQKKLFDELEIVDLESGFCRVRDLALDSYRRFTSVRELAAFCGGWGESSIVNQNADSADIDAWTLYLMLVVYRYCTPISDEIQWPPSNLSDEPRNKLKSLLVANNSSRLFWGTTTEPTSEFFENLQRSLADYPTLGFSSFCTEAQVPEIDKLVQELDDSHQSESLAKIRTILGQAADSDSGLFWLCSG